MTKAQLQQLYNHQRLSMMEVARHLGTSHARVNYWLKRYGIPRRSWSDSTYVKLNPLGHPFKVPSKLRPGQQTLFVAGLMLYWAEGRKEGYGIQLGNLDPRLLQLFVKFLREICHVNEKRLRISVRVYRAFSLSFARRYWAGALSLPVSQVLVYPHTDRRSRMQKQWSRYGIATLNYSSTRLKQWLDQALDQYVQAQLSGRTQRLPKAPAYPGTPASFGVRQVADELWVGEESSALLLN